MGEHEQKKENRRCLKRSKLSELQTQHKRRLTNPRFGETAMVIRMEVKGQNG